MCLRTCTSSSNVRLPWALSLGLWLASSPLFAAALTPHLVKDIAADTTVSSSPAGIVAAGSRLYFWARPPGESGGHSVFYTSDGTSEGTRPLREFDAMQGGASLQAVAVGSRVAFAAFTYPGGWELCVSDGSVDGTVSVGFLAPVFASVERLYSTGRQVFAFADRSHEGMWLMGWDGGSGQVKVIKKLPVSSVGFKVTVPALDLVFFAARVAGLRTELWQSDGTPEGTHRVVGSPQVPTVSEGNAVAIGTHCVFAAIGSTGEGTLWVTHGSADGTRLIKTAPVGTTIVMVAATPTQAFFLVGNGQLWATDGTPEGTRLLLESTGITRSFGAVGSRLFFTIQGVGSSTAMWLSDGSASGTHLVKSLAGVLSISALTGIGGNAFFMASQGDGGGDELGVSDGTAEGTRIYDLYPGTRGSGPSQFTELGGRVFFAAYHEVLGYELWTCGLSGAGAQVLLDINRSTRSSLPTFPRNADSWLVFEAYDEVHGRAIWKTDGTEQGTSLLADLTSDVGNPYVSPLRALVTVGDQVYVLARDDAEMQGVWRIDATSGARVRLARKGCPGELESLENIFSLGGSVYLIASTCDSEYALFRIDSQTGDLTMVSPLPSFHASPPPVFGALGSGRAFFGVFASDGAGGIRNELWSTDGTTAGTQRLPYGVVYQSHAIDGRLLYYPCPIPLSGSVGVCRSDGTPEGTYPLLPNPIPESPGGFIIQGDWALFAAGDADHGLEPWVTDGTEAGTHLLRDMFPGPRSSIPLGGPFCPVKFHDGVLFSAMDPSHGEQLWFTDGSEDGTRLFAPIQGGALDFELMDGTEFDGKLYLTVATLGAGAYYAAYDLYRTDGTSEGTYRYPKMELRLPEGDTVGLHVFKNRLFLEVNDPLYGFELFAIDAHREVPRRHLGASPGS